MLMIDVVGWLGAALLLLAYGGVSNKRLAPEGLGFQGMNLSGSAMLLANAGYHGAIPSATVNLIWIVIGSLALARSFARAR